jgi:hypothetical protein
MPASRTAVSVLLRELGELSLRTQGRPCGNRGIGLTLLGRGAKALAACPQKLRRRSTDAGRHSLEGSQRLVAQPAQQQPGAATVSRELLVAQQPSPMVDDGGVVGTAMGVHAADDHPGALGHAGSAVALEPRAGPAPHRPGGRTPRTGLGAHACIRSPEPAWSRAPSRGLPGRPTAPGMPPRSGGSGQTRPGGPAPSSGTVAILTGGSLQRSQAWLRRPGPRLPSGHLISDRRPDNQRGRRRSPKPGWTASAGTSRRNSADSVARCGVPSAPAGARGRGIPRKRP